MMPAGGGFSSSQSAGSSSGAAYGGSGLSMGGSFNVGGGSASSGGLSDLIKDNLPLILLAAGVLWYIKSRRC